MLSVVGDPLFDYDYEHRRKRLSTSTNSLSHSTPSILESYLSILKNGFYPRMDVKVRTPASKNLFMLAIAAFHDLGKYA